MYICYGYYIVTVWMSCFTIHNHGNVLACYTDYPDAASKAYVSQIVLKGKVSNKLQNVSNNANTFLYNATISIRGIKNVLKGRDLFQITGPQNLTIGPFSKKPNISQCIDYINIGRVYFFYVNITNDGFYRIVAPWDIASKRIRTQIRKITCKNCEPRAPVISAMQDVTVPYKSPFRLHCQAKGLPMPRFYWLKDNQPLIRLHGFEVTNRYRSSTLLVNKAHMKMSGTYSCIADNLIKKVQRQVTVTVLNRKKEGSDASTLMTFKHEVDACIKQQYCLNGGHCEMSFTSTWPKCRCGDLFMGERCGEMNLVGIFGNLMKILKTHEISNPVGISQVEKDRCKLSQDRMFIIIGAVTTICTFTTLGVLAYFLARKKRQELIWRREKTSIHSNYSQQNHNVHQNVARGENDPWLKMTSAFDKVKDDNVKEYKNPMAFDNISHIPNDMTKSSDFKDTTDGKACYDSKATNIADVSNKGHLIDLTEKLFGKLDDEKNDDKTVFELVEELKAEPELHEISEIEPFKTHDADICNSFYLDDDMKFYSVHSLANSDSIRETDILDDDLSNEDSEEENGRFVFDPVDASQTSTDESFSPNASLYKRNYRLERSRSKLLACDTDPLLNPLCISNLSTKSDHLSNSHIHVQPGNHNLSDVRSSDCVSPTSVDEPLYAPSSSEGSVSGGSTPTGEIIQDMDLEPEILDKYLEGMTTIEKLSFEDIGQTLKYPYSALSFPYKQNNDSF